MVNDYILPYALSISPDQLRALNGHNALLIWFTGLSGSGKSTIANALNQYLLDKNVHTCILDGDGVRKGLNAGLSFSPKDRRENVRRIAEVSNLMISHAGIVVIGAFVSPYEKDRNLIKDIVGEDSFIEIYISTPLEICEERDIKGLYKKARSGEIKNFTGIDAPYEIPENPHLTIDASRISIEKAIQQIMELINLRLYA